MQFPSTWEIKRSIGFEIDVIFTMLNDFLPLAGLSPTMVNFLDQIPSDMVTEIRLLLGEGKHFYSLMLPAAYAAGTIFEEDFTQATLPIRQMEIKDAVEGMVRQGHLDGINVSESPELSINDQWLRIYKDLFQQSAERLGFNAEHHKTHTQYIDSDLILLSRFLKGGDLHARFWHWMDRFYYQTYLPWRTTRLELMTAESERARMALGAPGSPLPVDWLPQSNPLRISAEIIETMQTQGLNVIFIVEPFQLPDFWVIYPHGLMTSFAEGKDLYTHFFAFIDDLSLRLKALADPTRLAILRAIRSSPQDNTLIATHLGVSRPTVSIHAKQLREAGLIRTYEAGRSVRHEVIYEEVRQLFHDLERFLDLPPED